ncbi:UNVERIFIED_CONTAM: hypothetical protein FKN15_067623 [Acipenser sinensis]
MVYQVQYTANGLSGAVYSQWFIRCSIQLMVYQVQYTANGLSGAVYSQWFIRCCIQPMVYQVLYTANGLSGAVYSQWFIRCCIQPMVYQVLYTANGLSGAVYSQWFIRCCIQPMVYQVLYTANGLSGAVYSQWFIRCCIQPMVYQVLYTANGLSGAVYSQWFIRCCIQPMVYQVLYTANGLSGAVYSQWFIRCCIQPMVYQVLYTANGLSGAVYSQWFIRLDLELKDQEGSTALWLTLQYITVSSDQSVNPFHDAPVENGTSFDENSFAARLIQRGSNPDAPDTSTGNCLLQRAAVAGNEAATLFLATHGAKVNHTNNWGETPLHTACRIGLANLTAELLQQGANPNLQTEQPLPRDSGAPPEQGQGVYLQSPLHMAIVYNHPDVVSVILEQKANALHATNNLQIIPDFSLKDSMDQTVLGLALWTGMHTIAAQLLGSGASINDTMSNGHTLLHMAIQRQDSKSALFLLEHQADINVRTRDRETALQLAISNQLPLVVDAICTRGADMSVLDEKGNPPLWLALEKGLEDIASTLDAEGRAPVHVAISNQHNVIIQLLISHPDIRLSVRDRQGITPFACAMTFKNNKAAEAILKREAGAAEQVDNKGRNFLHMAVQNSDIESVLFLISVQANVNSRVQDAAKQTPLHLAVQAGSEIIVRNLLLAGAKVTELTKHRQTALHLAAQQDLPTICSVLLENAVDFAAVDENGNNALHLAVMHGRLNNVRALLTESNINAEAFNLRGQSPMHILGQYGKENAAAIFELFLECMQEYPLDKPDNEGNTVLLLAYMKGNANLCRAIVRAGARLGINNNQGINIFNYQVATKQLLFRLLDMLSKEPPWCDGSYCYECLAKFGVTTRKHHCRHCGRLLCHKCSVKEIPIIKFDLNKPVRVCDICFDVLTLGGVS